MLLQQSGCCTLIYFVKCVINPSHFVSTTFRFELYSAFVWFVPVLPVGREGLPLRSWNLRIDSELEDSLALVERSHGFDRNSTGLAKVSRDWCAAQCFRIVIFGEVLFASDADLLCLDRQICPIESTRDFSTIGTVAKMATSL